MKRVHQGTHFVDKGWGHELWIVNNKKYCGKRMFFKKNKKCSLHFHMLKDETFFLEAGLLDITLIDQDGTEEKHVLNPGDCMHIPPGLVHQIMALEDSVLFEFSTTHFDEDSHRVYRGD